MEAWLHDIAGRVALLVEAAAVLITAAGGAPVRRSLALITALLIALLGIAGLSLVILRR
jgi:hypothetical protein